MMTRRTGISKNKILSILVGERIEGLPTDVIFLYVAVHPPSTTSSAPVMYDASSDAKNSTA